MHFEIIGVPIHFHLYGIASKVENQCFGEVGFRLMNEMWSVVKQANVQTTGINHWVYFANERMFVGVEVKELQHTALPASLEPIAFEIPRYLKHVHVGPYSGLPQKWRELKAELLTRGDTPGFPSLEVYGHSCDDPTKSETTILICLK